MNKLKYKFALFMQGRYGIDDFYKFLLAIYTVLLILNCFIRSARIYLALLLLLFYIFFRVFSKNIASRQKENAKYLILKRKVGIFLQGTKKRFSDKDHVYRRCPHCKATLRFPRKKGAHDAVCPKCRKKLKVKIYF